MDLICQIIITLCGVSSLFLIANKNKWGFVIGLVAQPFWLITTWTHHQYWLFGLSFVYAFNWGLGIRKWFGKQEILKEGL